MKEICLNVVSEIIVAILLIYSAYFEWKKGNKVVSVITIVLTIFVFWKAYENYRKIQVKTS